ncbi:LysR substrate-binding domain-containing protein [Azospirillum picis]|uniref:DNA-binding transcriptional LysR family regulator n=1 Tax=Azospirillum picis TaxID=488438 RepID=A0ABU0MNN5_9PROT|nr:LysR substrate-binding domain-containing protein [Azospirillum picis]MBP2301183.1 DNA-binding transcriptional LysR family regulator [Azospirillum picis]MDQ0534854.1 DNA-binding transcriptional LysR family regulator [Azospirillum picis]
MNLRQVEVFHAVMTNGTASRAAEVLRISQPAVSKAVQELEREIGFALFHRAKGRMVATAEGRLFFQEVSASFAGLTRLRAAAARIRDFGSGEIRVACLSALSTTILPKALRAFQRGHPDVSITVQTRLSSEVKDLVASSQFDIGLAADEIDVTGVDATAFMRQRLVIAVPADHPLAERESLCPTDLDGLPFVALAPEDTARRRLDVVLAEQGVKPKIVLETPYSTTVCAMVQAGIGCGLVNPLTAEPYLGRGVVTRGFEPAIRSHTLLLLPPDRRPSRIVADFIRDLMEHAAA